MKYKKILYSKFLIIIIVAGIFTSGVLYLFYETRERAIITSEVAARQEQTVHYIEKKLELVQAIGNVLWLSDELQKLKNATPENIGYFSFYELQGYINDLILALEDIQSIHIYFNKSHILITSDNSVFYNLDETLQNYFNQLIEVSKERQWILGYPEYDFPYSYKKASLFSYICPIYALENNKLAGVITIQVREKAISNLTEADENLEAFYIVDEYGNMIYKSEYNKVIFEKLQEKGFINNQGKYYEGTKVITRDKNELVAVSFESDYNNWRYISVYNVAMPSILEKSSYIYFVAIVAIYVLVFGLIVWISGKEVGNPVNTLVYAMKQAKKGNLDYRIMTERTDEMGYIYQQFNNTMQHIQNLLDQVVEEQVMKKNAEYKLLQAQIHPHFIFNIFNNMIWLLEQQNYGKLKNMLEATVGYYKTSLNYGNMDICVEDVEIQLNCYATIQKIRFGDLFDYSIEFEREISSYTMPNLLLQPLLENAIGHGASEKEGTTYISVSGKRISNYMEFKVLDDGIGICEKRLEDIRRAIEQKNCEGNDFFALSNIARRIALYFQDDAELSISSEYGMWTEVTLKIPLKESI